MSDQSDATRVGGYLTVFAIGALIGTGIALLYAPRSGKETRALLVKKGRDIKGQADEAIGDARSFIRNKKDELVAAVEAGSEAMHTERAKHQKAS